MWCMIVDKCAQFNGIQPALAAYPIPGYTDPAYLIREHHTHAVKIVIQSGDH